ncbi:MAG: TatD family hydrolase [Verrucomicrobiota bacterium]|jgi:TatD DNase family protein
MEFCDAHCHYQFAEVPYAAVEQARADGVGLAMINGSAPSDWEDVSALGRRDPRNLLSFGLHPWDVPTAPPDWAEQLRGLLLKNPAAGVGEMGLDRWVKDFDALAQEQAFRVQLALAVEFDRALTIHCVKAIGPLMDILRAADLPLRGFLLHSWNGPVELVPELARLGAYFSFSAHHLIPRKADLRVQFAAAIPRERILVETDAPALCPAPEFRVRALPPAADGTEQNHPSNLVRNNEELARTLGVSSASSAEMTARNFRRLFLGE